MEPDALGPLATMGWPAFVRQMTLILGPTVLMRRKVYRRFALLSNGEWLQGPSWEDTGLVLLFVGAWVLFPRHGGQMPFAQLPGAPFAQVTREPHSFLLEPQSQSTVTVPSKG